MEKNTDLENISRNIQKTDGKEFNCKRLFTIVIPPLSMALLSMIYTFYCVNYVPRYSYKTYQNYSGNLKVKKAFSQLALSESVTILTKIVSNPYFWKKLGLTAGIYSIIIYLFLTFEKIKLGMLIMFEYFITYFILVVHATALSDEVWDFFDVVMLSAIVTIIVAVKQISSFYYGTSIGGQIFSAIFASIYSFTFIYNANVFSVKSMILLLLVLFWLITFLDDVVISSIYMKKESVEDVAVDNTKRNYPPDFYYDLFSYFYTGFLTPKNNVIFKVIMNGKLKWDFENYFYMKKAELQSKQELYVDFISLLLINVAFRHVIYHGNFFMMLSFCYVMIFGIFVTAIYHMASYREISMGLVVSAFFCVILSMGYSFYPISL